MKTLIQGQGLIDGFLTLLSQGANHNSISIHQASNGSSITAGPVPMDMQMKLPDIYNPSTGSNKYKEIFHGNLTPYGNDHSAADLALSGYLARQGLTPHEADQVFRTSKLYRDKWDQMRGNKTYGERTLNQAFSGIQNQVMSAPTISTPLKKSTFLNITSYRPVYISQGMPPRQFVGPKICDGIRLFPSNALSTLVALGAMGKTSLLISIASHVAAGKAWNGYPLNQQKSVIFFCPLRFTLVETKGQLTFFIILIKNLLLGKRRAKPSEPRVNSSGNLFLFFKITVQGGFFFAQTFFNIFSCLAEINT